MFKIACSLSIVAIAMTTHVYAADFSISFTWGDFKKCTSGNPFTVSNPPFKISGAPAGTAKIRFQMKDLAVPDYYHGGGTAKYSGGGSIAPGAFKYKSPCPPGGRHTYEWTAVALDAKGKKLGTAKARRQYP